MGKQPPFFLVPGGPFHALMRRLGLARGDAADVARFAVAFGLLPWLGLMLIAGVERIASGCWPALVMAPSVHVRLLVAIPSFGLAERSLHVRTRRCIEWLDDFVDPADERLSRYVRWAAALRDALGPEVFVLALVVINAALTLSGIGSVHLGLGQSVQQKLTIIQCWYLIVALPIFQFLGLRWIGHWGLWTLLLLRISRLPLRPIASHPDKRGGLGFLAEPQVGFAYVLFGINSVIAAGTAFGLEAQSFDPEAFSLRLAGVVLVGLLTALGPLLPFALPLFRARFAGLRDFDQLAADYTSRFQRRWVESSDREELLGTADLQSLADLGTSCEVVRQMRIVPLTRDAVALVVGAVCVSYFVLLLAKIPFVELLQNFADSFLGQRLF